MADELDELDCQCELCSCGATVDEGHLCDYCLDAHPNYHIHDCDECIENYGLQEEEVEEN